VTQSPTVIVPIRDFSGMSRLSAVLDIDGRSRLARELSTRTVNAAVQAGLDVVVVSSSRDVIDWAGTIGLRVLEDPRMGLSTAAASATASLDGSPWIVLHADLPLVSALGLRHIADLGSHVTVLVPSQDGGTNVIASTGIFPFAYGPGSFHRHFASSPHATIISNAGLSIDIDTPLQLSAFPELLDTSSLTP
jgi:2-phospho-L-lactate guanylyltransferase